MNACQKTTTIWRKEKNMQITMFIMLKNSFSNETTSKTKLNKCFLCHYGSYMALCVLRCLITNSVVVLFKNI